MAILEINSRMAQFRLIDAIHQADEDIITGLARFNRALPFVGLEAMAQLAALHVRHQCDFSGHAYLLKVIFCQGLPVHEITGQIRISASLKSRSRQAFRYGVTAVGHPDGAFCSELLIGLQDYDSRFQAHHLKGHYRQMFAGLRGRGR